jgi:hypothetical protein
LQFELELHLAECEFLAGSRSSAERRLDALSERCALLEDQAAVACLRILVCATDDRPKTAVEVCLQFLRRAGIEWPSDLRVALEQQYADIMQLLADRTVDSLSAWNSATS